MDIGDHVIWCGRAHRVRGFDPMSVLERCLYLEDEETGERVRVPAAEVESEGEDAAPAPG